MTALMLARRRRDLAIACCVRGGMSLRATGAVFELSHTGVRKIVLKLDAEAKRRRSHARLAAGSPTVRRAG